ncbi:hypothetical protein EGT86_02425 [Burkholderia pseudomallei]|nr:hypothetical protein EGT86_02425 [Burkholderia pseudomallei]
MSGNCVCSDVTISFCFASSARTLKMQTPALTAKTAITLANATPIFEAIDMFRMVFMIAFVGR